MGVKEYCLGDIGAHKSHRGSRVVPIIVHLLLSLNDDVRELAVWALGNIAGGSPPSRDLLL